MNRPRRPGSSERAQRTSARAVEFVPSSPTGSSVSDGDPPGYIPPFDLVVSGGYRPTSETSPSSFSDSPPNPNKRNYEELEEITFANPKSFHSMAFAIAATRGTTLIIADDRTHKVTSAYMHICCDFRRSGCPFILKLTKAKEGGWVMKSPKATDVDPKQRSQYRCRHTPGAEPESLISSGSPVGRPQVSPPGLGTLPTITAPLVKKKKPQVDSPIIKRAPVLSGKDLKPILPPSARESRPAKLRTSNNSAHGSPGSPSKLVPHKVEDTPRVVYLNAEPGDRALAPPFERSQSLASRITPVLGMDRRESGSPPVAGVGGSYRPSRLSAPPLTYRPLPPKMPEPIVTSLPEWTAFLTLLDPELIPYAAVLANPAIDVSPASFFKEDEEMRTMLLDSLEMSAWPKLKLKSKIKARGAEVWNMLLEDKGKGTSQGGSSNGDGSVKMKREDGEAEVKTPLPTTTVGNAPLPFLHAPSFHNALSGPRRPDDRLLTFLALNNPPRTHPAGRTPRRELRLATGQQAATLANAVAGAHFNSHGESTEISIPISRSYTGLPVEEVMSEEEEEGDEATLVITPIVAAGGIEQTFAMPEASFAAAPLHKRKVPPAGDRGEGSGPVAKKERKEETKSSTHPSTSHSYSKPTLNSNSTSTSRAEVLDPFTRIVPGVSEGSATRNSAIISHPVANTKISTEGMKSTSTPTTGGSWNSAKNMGGIPGISEMGKWGPGWAPDARGKGKGGSEGKGRGL